MRLTDLVVLETKICLTIEVLIEQFCNENCSALRESDETEGKQKRDCDSDSL